MKGKVGKRMSGKEKLVFIMLNRVGFKLYSIHGFMILGIVFGIQG